MNGKLVALNYIVKDISFESQIKIQVPHEMVALINGDKQVSIRYL